MNEKKISKELEEIYSTAQDLKEIAEEMRSKLLLYEAVFKKIGELLQDHRETIDVHSEGLLETAERVDEIEKKMKPVSNDMYV